MEYGLLIDTSTSDVFLTLSKGGAVVASHSFPHQNNLSASLLPSIKDFLQQDLKYISIGTGPGSYTGVRVGSTVAASLAFALDIPLIPFCSLLAFLPFENGSFASVQEAKSGKHFVLKAVKEGNLLSQVSYGMFLEPLPSILEGIPVVISSHNPSSFTPGPIAAWTYNKFLAHDLSAPENKVELLYFN